MVGLFFLLDDSKFYKQGPRFGVVAAEVAVELGLVPGGDSLHPFRSASITDIIFFMLWAMAIVCPIGHTK